MITPTAPRRLAVALSSVLAACAARPGDTARAPACRGCTAYEADLERWRAEREDDLRGEQGWLALAGLYWLGDGVHRLGADPRADIVFPAGAPANVGTLTVQDGEVRLHVADGVDARIGAVPVTDIVLRSDLDPDRPADRVTLGGRFTFLIIARGGRLGVRLYDAESPARREFAGLRAFPAREKWRVQARFEPYVPPRQVDHPTVIGTPHRADVPGVAVFTIDGKEHRLTPIVEHTPSGDELLFVFRDLTSGAETYTGGRFLLTGLPEHGVVELDFNRAHNPPCAFTAYATCPIPLRDNYLPIRVEAGEKDYEGQH